MPIFTEVIEPCKAGGGPRAVRWVPLPGGGALAVDDRRRTRAYLVNEFVPESGWWGRAFRLAKADGSDVYDVFLSHDGFNHHCTCAGATYRPRGRCVHVQALLAVAANGWLPNDAANPDADYASAEASEPAPF